jgi:hypothetical protein
MVREEKQMPTKKTKTDNIANSLKTRISELTDRIAILENNLRLTQERVQKDMVTLQNTLQDWSKRR